MKCHLVLASFPPNPNMSRAFAFTAVLLFLFKTILGDLAHVELVSQREVEQMFQLALGRAIQESVMLEESKSDGKDILNADNNPDEISERSLIHSIHHLRRNLAKKLKRLKELKDKGIKRIKDIRDEGLKHIKKTLGKHKEHKKHPKKPKKNKKELKKEQKGDGKAKKTESNVIGNELKNIKREKKKPKTTMSSLEKDKEMKVKTNAEKVKKKGLKDFGPK